MEKECQKLLAHSVLQPLLVLVDLLLRAMDDAFGQLRAKNLMAESENGICFKLEDLCCVICAFFHYKGLSSFVFDVLS